MKVYNYQANGIKKEVSFDAFTFSGGEEHIRFNAQELSEANKIEIVTRLNSSKNIMQLILAVDALRRATSNCTAFELVIPYFPYARQDRVCVEGEALGAAVMADLINSLKMDKVTVWDAHSDVSTALLSKVVNIPQSELLLRNGSLRSQLSQGHFCLVSPDAGASKKTMKISEIFAGEIEVIQAQKIRDLKTGDIIKTEISGDIDNKHILIADDICDGGRTFIELAKVLKAHGAASIALFITHGIFSKGFEVFEGLIDAIYTTDSFKPSEEYQHNHNLKIEIIKM